MNCCASPRRTALAELVTPKKVVIVGGGAAGMAVAKQFKGSEHSVVVVDRMDYFDWSIASPRSIMKPDDVARVGYCMPQDKICEFYGCTYMQGSVVNIEGDGVTVAVAGESGPTKVSCDAVVVAIGGSYASGAPWKPRADETTMALRIEGFRAERAKIEAASSVVVAGAGLAGVEVAGEIKTEFPEKSVTLVGTFLATSSERMRTKSRRALEKLGVVLTEGRINESAPVKGEVTTSKGEKLGCDVLLSCAGFVFSGAKLMDKSLAASVSSKGQLVCKPTLQLETCDTVFSCGDILHVPEGKFTDPKGFQHATSTATVVATNVKALLSGAKLVNFPWATSPVYAPVFSTFGPKVGVGDMGMPSLMSGLEDSLCRTLKCKECVGPIKLEIAQAHPSLLLTERLASIGARSFFTSLQHANFGKGKTWSLPVKP
jgi:NADH dehydrogenase FAD-containing subunit